MSNAISKGDMSAFQRWEMTSFGDARAGSKSELEAAASAKAIQIETEKAREAARTEAYAIGFKEGYAAGFDEGHQAGYAAGEQKISAETSHIAHIGQQFTEQLQTADAAIGQDLLALALDLAQAIIKTSLELDQDLIIPIVRDAIEKLPALQQSANLLLHPEDAAIIKAEMGSELEKNGWRIVADQHIQRGGCEINTPQNMVDASLATRWNRLSEVIKPRVR